MRLIRNTGGDRVIDALRKSVVGGPSLDVASPAFSLFAFAELRRELDALERVRVVLPAATDLALSGSVADRGYRNRLQLRWLARECARWMTGRVELRGSPTPLPQSALVAGEPRRAITGSCAFTTDGLGVAPGNPSSLTLCSETPEEAAVLSAWFTSLWGAIPASDETRSALLGWLNDLASHASPALVYHVILYHLFRDMGAGLDEERIVRSATGIKSTAVWKKLYKFQRDGVVGAIDKLERFGGCIIADSVGLGKTFEALAIIKYYELRNDRVLVLCPKRLRDNWTLYRANDRRNPLGADRLNYDVLNHTDLSRDDGLSGDIDLSHVSWGNYDLVVIDESHNFRNAPARLDRDTRYARLMREVIKAGVKTRVLMLSATPVNNRLADLKNQIAFVTEANDTALVDHGIASIESTVRVAQAQFNLCLKLDEGDRQPARLMEMLGFDYFKLLDLLTIARSRKHIEKYYGTSETGTFPERLRPINVKADVDRAGRLRPVGEINDEIRRLNLSAYAPLRYVLPAKRAAYDEKYNTKVKDGVAVFRQADREESLVHLLRVNLLKRMESSVTSFALTLGRQLTDVERLKAKLDAHVESVDELSIDDIEIDDPTFETLLIGAKVKVLLSDVDRLRWAQDLTEDRDRLAALLSGASAVDPSRDAKLERLKDVIAGKLERPWNAGNRKVLVFTAFADTANYLYRQLSGWARANHGVHSALITGTGGNQTTVPGLRKDLGTLLSAFSPRSKERAADMAGEGEIDLLIATDCISEGQNLQDCDTVVNYDIHWNPVRIIQRFGRIDRIGSRNACVQLVNFWPNMELEEYIGLEQRVTGRMVLLDISATGEENIIQPRPGNQMNDLEYRRKQLEKLQDAVIDLEDLSSGVSITDLTLNDFRIDLSTFLRERPGRLESLSLGTYAVAADDTVPPGVLFCLRAESEALSNVEPGYPLAPHYLVHVGDDGAVLLPFTQAKQVLDRLKKLALGREAPDAEACARFDRATRSGESMGATQKLLGAAVAAITGKKEERAVASLFVPGGTHALKGEFQGTGDFEVVAFVVVLATE